MFIYFQLHYFICFFAVFEEKRIFKSLGVYTGSKHNDLQNVDKTFQFFMTIVMKSCFQLIKGVLWTKDFC